MIIAIIIFFTILFIPKKNKLYKTIALLLGLALVLISPELHKTIIKVPSTITLIYGLFGGYISYIFSILIVKGFVNFNSLFPFVPFFSHKYEKRSWNELLLTSLSCIYEEFLWRGTIQGALGSNILAVPITSSLFTLSHKKKRTANIQLIDIFIFSLIVGTLFFIFQDIWMVSLIHYIRNFLVICNMYVCSELI